MLTFVEANFMRLNMNMRMYIMIRILVDDYSNHPIAEIWNENESRQSPTNILEPVFDETPQVQPTAPSQIETSDEDLNPETRVNPEQNANPQSSDHSKEEQELIESLKASSISSKSPSRASSVKATVSVSIKMLLI